MRHTGRQTEGQNKKKPPTNMPGADPEEDQGHVKISHRKIVVKGNEVLSGLKI